MDIKTLKQYAARSLELRTALRGAMQFGNVSEEKRLNYELVTNNALIVDALIDFLERQEKSGRNPEVGIPIDRNVNVIKHPSVDPNSGNGRWNK